MEVFISNLDSRITKEDLKQSLTPVLQKIQIQTFDVRKRNDKTFAQLTIADLTRAEKLLKAATETPNFFCSPSGRQAHFKISRFPPHPQLIKVLQRDDKNLEAQKARPKHVKRHVRSNIENDGKIGLCSIECGRWETNGNGIVFVPYYIFGGSSSIERDRGALIVTMETSTTERYQLCMELYNIQSLSLSKTNSKKTLSITLMLAPKIFRDDQPELSQLLHELFPELSLGAKTGDTAPRSRECALPNSTITGTCLVYRLTIKQEAEDFQRRIRGWIGYQIPLREVSELSNVTTIANLADQVLNLNVDVARRDCSFCWKFQIQALWANALLSPSEVQTMLPEMDALRARLGEAVLIEALRRVVLSLPMTDDTTRIQNCGSKGAVAVMIQQAEFLLPAIEQRKPMRDGVSIHRVTVTPTGIYLYGPEDIAANRILRQYRQHQDCFLRVIFVDEDEERIKFDKEFSNHKVLREKFLSILSKGLDIAGEHFDFLGFSHSSLRAQTCWFMRPFMYEGKMLFASDLIKQLGDFSAIQCPAKCAARIGQAFTESTSAVEVDPTIVQTVPDTKLGQYIFTDGCGTLSTLVWRSLGTQKASRSQPTSYQIRYKGAKGMLTLDTSLEGHQIRLRKSMVKFDGSPSNEIEICGTNSRPLPFKLNRQIIKILEDLDVPTDTFERLQENAIQKLQFSARSVTSAIDFVILNLSDSFSGLSTLLKHLQTMGVDVSEDKFFRDVLGALLQVQLREIKYRSRIPVPDALTLYGISDESKWLKEGEVFVTFASEGSSRHSHLDGQVAVTRSPALHPGDIQVVQAVTPPLDSYLWDLRNCIVFSQRGQRDLPSMLSGGDLDGDLYNIIYDEDLIPRKTATPAVYPPIQPVDIGRSVTANDMASFFIDFMENDQLGRIATLHQVLADQDSTYSAECLLLAELHSTAVDFSKSGIPVDIKKIPKTPPYRPDFMAPSASTKVEKGIKRETDLSSTENNQNYRYYESDRVLGKLYRAVNEDHFFQNLEDDNSSIFSKGPDDTVLGDILGWLENQMSFIRLYEYFETAKEIRDYYESNMLDIMLQYTIHRNDSITEKEVFIGTILGRSGAGNKYQREQSDNMKRRFNRDLADIKSWMEAETVDQEDGLLYLSAACLYQAVRIPSRVNLNLSSFGWFSAGICVPELVKESR